MDRVILIIINKGTQIRKNLDLVVQMVILIPINKDKDIHQLITTNTEHPISRDMVSYLRILDNMDNRVIQINMDNMDNKDIQINMDNMDNKDNKDIQINTDNKITKFHLTLIINRAMVKIMEIVIAIAMSMVKARVTVKVMVKDTDMDMVFEIIEFICLFISEQLNNIFLKLFYSINFKK